LAAARLSAIPVPFVDNACKVVEVKWLSRAGTSIRVLSRRTGRACIVEFAAVYGLRVLHELDLAALWTSVAPELLRSTWLFEVHGGVWVELESRRPDFNVAKESPLREFLIVGYQECVSVMADRVPTVREAG